MSNDENYLKHIFYVPLIHLKVENWESKKQNLLDLYEQVLIEYNDNVWTNYHDDALHLNESVASLLKDEIIQFGNFLGFKEIKIRSSWFEKANQDNFHCPHNHGMKGYSSVCYVEYDKSQHEATNFISPFTNFITGDLLKYSPKVEEGSIIFFPSSITHYTNPNKSNKERKILSFNLSILE